MKERCILPNLPYQLKTPKGRERYCWLKKNFIEVECFLTLDIPQNNMI